MKGDSQVNSFDTQIQVEELEMKEPIYYDINTEEYNITKNNHKKLIKDLLMINDNTFTGWS